MPSPTLNTAQTDTKAKVSLILGVLSLPLSILAGIPAIIFGHISRSSIRKSGGQLKGKGLALGGLLFGYLSIATLPLVVAFVPFYIIALRPAGNPHPTSQSTSRNPIDEIAHAEAQYHVSYPAQGYAPDLATLGSGPAGHAAMASPAFAGLLDETLGKAECTGQTWCSKGDYKYIIQSDTGEPHKIYTITATPSKGGKSYCVNEDGVLRYDLTKESLTVPYTHRQCALLPPL